MRILRIHIRSVNPPLHSRQPWDLTPHSHRLWESWIPIRSKNPSHIHISHVNPVNSLQWWEFSFDSRVGCESMSNSHWAWESNLKLNWPRDFDPGTLVSHGSWHCMRCALNCGKKKGKMMDSHFWCESWCNSHLTYELCYILQFSKDKDGKCTPSVWRYDMLNSLGI